MYDDMSSGCEQERSDLREKTVTLQSELDTFDADSENVNRFVELAKKFTSFDELTPALINEFVDKVIVHEAVWFDGLNGNGRPCVYRTQEVEVYLKYIGSFDVPDTRTAEQIEAERIAAEKLEARRAYQREKTCQYNERKRQRKIAASKSVA